MSSNKSDRSMSPSTLSEEGRRELLARQHRALYGNDAGNFLPQGGFGEEGSSGRDSGSNVPSSATTGMRGNSPRTADPFGMGPAPSQQANVDNTNQSSAMPKQDVGRSDISATAATGTAPTQFGNIDSTVQQAGNTSTSPASGESPTRGVTKSTTAPIGSGMGPIGTRLSQQAAPNQSINKRSTTPLTSPMNSFGFGAAEQSSNNERSGSANSNPAAAQKEPSSGMGAWGTGSGVWGSNKIGATSVWG
jgi:hypothetical protein